MEIQLVAPVSCEEYRLVECIPHDVDVVAFETFSKLPAHVVNPYFVLGDARQFYVTVRVADGNKLHLTWKPAGPQKKIKEYRIYRDGAQVGTSATTEFKDENVEGGVSYT